MILSAVNLTIRSLLFFCCVCAFQCIRNFQINLTMATANDGIQAVGYYDDGTGVHLKMKNLTIFRSQYNVGRKMIEKVYEANVLNLTDSQKPDGKRKFENINMQFLGPTYTSLRDQTRRDLGNFLQERVSLSHDEINGICQSRVLNSSSIPKDYDTMRFIKVLRKNPLNFLHVLVLDEADWGISSESVIDKFLQHLASIEEEIRQSHQIQPSLIILLVSATIDVLACVINKFTDEKQRVDWYNLRHSDENKFGAPYYRDINRLRLCNDLNASLLALPTISDRSLFIAEEYYKTIKNCLNNIIEKQNINWNSSTAGNALKFLLPGNNTEEISTRARSADYYSEENYMVLVRLNLNEHVTHLHGKILRIFKDMSEQIKLDFQPFEVIQLIQDSDSIVQQLSPKAIRYLHLDDQVSESDFDVSRLNNLPCLILVNAKLGRGERLPSSCMAFDVRSRYKGDAADMKGFASTFIQDVGRCCGHHKPEALILMSVTDENQCASGKANSLTLEDIQFPRLHGLLTKDQAATISHPERNTKSYSKLSSYIIVLDAEPQIGKTGAILGMLDILYAEHTSLLKAASIFQRTTVSQRTPNQPSDLKKITADLCRIVDNPDEMIKIRIDKLKNALHANNLFQEYHNLIRQSEAIETLSRSIYNNNLSTPMNSARKAKQDAFTIVDCGCGLYGIVHIFRKNSSELDLPVHVFGIDLHEEILKLEKLKPVIQNVIFTGCVADMASTNQLDLQNTTYNVVLYCLSLFENDITRHICWANNQLKTGGMLIIADVIRRFSQNFRTSVEKHGFEGLDPYTVCDQFEVWIFKKQSCSNDLITVQLNPY